MLRCRQSIPELYVIVKVNYWLLISGFILEVNHDRASAV